MVFFPLMLIFQRLGLLASPHISHVTFIYTLEFLIGLYKVTQILCFVINSPILYFWLLVKFSTEILKLFSEIFISSIISLWVFLKTNRQTNKQTSKQTSCCVSIPWFDFIISFISLSWSYLSCLSTATVIPLNSLEFFHVIFIRCHHYDLHSKNHSQAIVS